MIKSYFLFIFIGLFLCFLPSQELVTHDDFVNMVLNHHPVAKQADLKEKIGVSKLLKAKGNFDPKIDADYKAKSFDNKNYYQFANTSFKVPTWIGVDVKFNYSWNNGDFINPENSLPNKGLVSAGLSLPVLQGLLYDKRRASLQTAKNYRDLGVVERIDVLSNLVYEASNAYWDWYNAHKILKIQEEGLLLAKKTFRFVEESYQLGSKPAVDTLEALIQIQNRQYDLMSAQVNFENTKLIASSFLWIDGQTIAMFIDDALPQSEISKEEAIDESLKLIDADKETFSQNSPKNLIKSYKVQNLEIERKLQREMLKPKLDVGYNFISNPEQQTFIDNLNINNYKWNARFEMPLMFRKARGDFQIANAKLQIAEFDYENSLLQQRIKIETLIRKIDTQQEQLKLIDKNVVDNGNLVVAEKRKFELGESSLFLINYREIYLLEVMIKKADLETKIEKTLTELNLIIGGISTF